MLLFDTSWFACPVGCTVDGLVLDVGLCVRQVVPLTWIGCGVGYGVSWSVLQV